MRKARGTHLSELPHHGRRPRGATPWGFLGLRIPTKENVLALIEVAPALKAR